MQVANAEALSQYFGYRPAYERVVLRDDSAHSAYIICTILEKNSDATRDVVPLACRMRIHTHYYIALRLADSDVKRRGCGLVRVFQKTDSAFSFTHIMCLYF